ncbi:GNAT family N-acetyltransferase [Candidatus Dependentiae bacterium]|nr:GNAT family N-acetyltransferase [Candidatus Dependentiae bacterium]
MFDVLNKEKLKNKFINNSKITVLRPCRNDIDIAVKWTIDENWNPGINDADIYYQTDPSGFFMGVYNDEPIGFVFSIFYENNFAVAGVFIVKKEFRNKLLGAELGWKFLAHIKDRNISINAVKNKVKFYGFLGFKPAFNINRYCYVKQHDLKISNLSDDYKIIPIDNNFIYFNKIINYDRCCFPADRSKLIRLWIFQSQSFSFCVKDSENNICGYGVLKKAFCGYRFEPLYADNFETAEYIFSYAVNFIKIGEPVFMDIPENNPAALLLAKKYNFKNTFSMTRMYNKNEPEIDKNKIFGLWE